MLDNRVAYDINVCYSGSRLLQVNKRGKKSYDYSKLSLHKKRAEYRLQA